MTIHTVISGGQTGVDRAALDAALSAGLKIGGWCPPGREAEDSRIPDVYTLKETDRRNSPVLPDVPRSQRTEWNVRDADATLILGPEECFGPGTEAMKTFCSAYRKPCLIVHELLTSEIDRILGWLEYHHAGILNIGGPSERDCKGIAGATYAFLRILFTNL